MPKLKCDFINLLNVHLTKQIISVLKIECLFLFHFVILKVVSLMLCTQHIVLILYESILCVLSKKLNIFSFCYQ